MTEDKKGLFGSLKDIYVKKYKLLMIIPFLLLVLAFAQIIGQYAVTGDFVNRGISLQGGVSVTIPEGTADVFILQDALSSAFPEGDILVRKFVQAKGIVVDASDVASEALVSEIKNQLGELSQEEYSV